MTKKENEEVGDISLDDEALRDVRHLGSDVGIPPEVLSRVRGQIVAAEGKPGRPRFRNWILGGIAAAALAVAGTLAINTMMYMPSAAAQEVLGKAARTVKEKRVAPNQYRKLTISETGVLMGESGDKPYALKTSSPSTMYIPGDPAKEWVWVRAPRQTGDVILGTVPAQDAQDMKDTSASQTVRGLQGQFYGPAPAEGSWQVPTSTFMANLPRDPHKLHERLVKDAYAVGTFAGPEDEAFTLVGDILRTEKAPADLRAALFEAVGKLRGVNVFEEKVVDGRRVIPVGFIGEARGERREFLFDAATFEWAGEQTTATRERDGLPAGTVVYRSTVTVELVNSAP